MKKPLFFPVLILSFLALGFAKAQNIQFEDPNFKTILLESSPDNKIAYSTNGNYVAIDANGDGEISRAEALNIRELLISDGGAVPPFIHSMKEIEYFTNLTTLNCYDLLKLESLDLSALIKLETLGYLIHYNQKEVDISVLSSLILPKTPTLWSITLDGPLLEDVNITGSQVPNLQSLDIEARYSDEAKNITISDLPKLETLFCGPSSLNTYDPDYNNLAPNISLSNLPKINKLGIKGKNITINNLPNLTELDCSAVQQFAYNPVPKVESLVLSNIPKLITILAEDHALKSLDLSNVPSLVTLILNCNYNNETYINETLENLNLSKNINLEGLGLTYNAALKTLDVSHNINLGGMELPGCTGIETLDISHNINFSTLDLYGCTGIKTLDVSHNINLETLNLYGCTGLTSLYMKNGVEKTFNPTINGIGGGYYLFGTNLNYICCDDDEIDAVKDYVQDINNSYYPPINPTITSDCKTYGLGTEDLSPQAKVALYPNPVKEVLYFSASGKVIKAEIYDLNGRLMKTAAVSNNSVNVSNLSKGVYFIVLKTDKGTVKEKFIKN